MISPIDSWVADKTGLRGNLNPETLKIWQRKKLKETLDYARKNTKFYSDKLGSVTELEDLPFTMPSDIANDPLAFLAVPQNTVERVTTLSNSGTTHLKKRVFFSKADLERIKDFFAIGMSSMVKKGDHAQILISNKTENSLGSLLSESLSRIGVISEISGAIRTVDTAIKASRNADCLVGMPSEILYMSRKAPELRPKSVLLAADIAPQSVINSIKETWKCNVFIHHGHSEFGYGCAVDCEYHNGLHLRDTDHIFEIIDPNTDKPCNPGVSGEIVITTLTNEAMPLIRYRTGNISQIIDTPCKCGSLLHRLGNIEGRISDYISIVDGKTINIHQLDEILFNIPSVYGFDASLIYEWGRITLQLTIESSKRLDLDLLKSMLPEELNIQVNYGNADPFVRRGKRRISGTFA